MLSKHLIDIHICNSTTPMKRHLSITTYMYLHLYIYMVTGLLGN